MARLEAITAAVLVGGLGSRLRSVVDDRPKPLADVGGRPFLSALLDQLLAAGVRRAVLCTGHRGAQVEAHYGDNYRGMALAYSHETEPRGTGGALRLAAPLLDSDPVLAMNGDSYCAVDLPAFLAEFERQQVDAGMVLTHVPETAAFGRVEVDAAGRIARFCEKGGAARPGWINAGIYLLRRALVQSIPAEQSVSLERTLFPGWIARGMLGWSHGGRFLDIGTPESLRQAAEFLARLAPDEHPRT